MELENLPENTTLELDVRNNIYVDNDIVEIFDDFSLKAAERNITINLVSQEGVSKNPTDYSQFFVSSR